MLCRHPPEHGKSLAQRRAVRTVGPVGSDGIRGWGWGLMGQGAAGRAENEPLSPQPVLGPHPSSVVYRPLMTPGGSPHLSEPWSPYLSDGDATSHPGEAAGNDAASMDGCAAGGWQNSPAARRVMSQGRPGWP